MTAEVFANQAHANANAIGTADTQIVCDTTGAFATGGEFVIRYDGSTEYIRVQIADATHLNILVRGDENTGPPVAHGAGLIREILTAGQLTRALAAELPNLLVSQGDIEVEGPSGPVRLTAGPANSILTSTGPGNPVQWATGATFTSTVTVPAPVNGTDAATKAYVDGVAQGLSVKSSVKAQTATNTALNGLLVIDGYQTVDGDRVLLTGQTTASQNGIWVAHAGAWTRPTDFATGSNAAGAFTFVEGGTTGAAQGWTEASASVVTVDTTAQTWTKFSAAGATDTLAGLSDVLLSAVADGQVLTYHAATSKWINAAATGGGGGGGTTISSVGVPDGDEVQASFISSNPASDHFRGSALGAAWVVEGTAPVNVVKNSVLSVTPGASEGGVWEAFAPSGAFTVEARLQVTVSGGQAILAVKDSSTGTLSTGNWIEVGFNGADGANTLFLNSVDAGVETVRANASFPASRYPWGQWIYLQLSRDAANNFTAKWSFDRVVWRTIGTYNKTLAVAKLGRREVGTSTVDWDFIDVVDGSSTSPLQAALAVTGGDQAWTPFTYQNGWVDIGAGEGTGGYRKDALGFVHLKGAVKNGTAGTAISTLPVGYRPAEVTEFLVGNGAGSVSSSYLDVNPDGTIVPGSGAGNSRINLDGLTFYAGGGAGSLVTGVGSTAPLAQARVHAATAQAALVANTLTLVNFDTIDYDTQGSFNTATHQFKAPVAAEYLIQARIEIAPASNSDFDARIYVNGTLRSRGNELGTAVSGLTVQDVLQLNAGDLVDIRAQSTGTPTISTPDSFRTFASFTQLPSQLAFLTGSGGDQSWINVTGGVGFQNGWTDYSNGSDGHPMMSYRKDALGFVHLRGLVKSGTVGLGTAIFTLPVGYRPEADLQTPVWSNTQLGEVYVGSNGVVSCANVNSSFVYIDGITFYAGPVTAVGLSSANEDQASILINAQSPGAAANISDHFLGSALAGAWTQEGAAFTDIVVGKSVFAPNNGAAWSRITRPYTPTAAMRVEMRMQLGPTSNAQLMLAVGDSGAGGLSVGEQMMVRILLAGGLRVELGSVDAGVFTARGTAVLLGGYSGAGLNWVYLALARDGANTWTGYWSTDRARWVSLGNFAKTFVVSKLAVLASSSLQAAVDFVDVVA